MRRRTRPEVNCERVRKQVLPKMWELLERSFEDQEEKGLSGYFDAKKFHIMEESAGTPGSGYLTPMLYSMWLKIAEHKTSEVLPLVGTFFYHTHPRPKGTSAYPSYKDKTMLNAFKVPHYCIGGRTSERPTAKSVVNCWLNQHREECKFKKSRFRKR